MKRYLDSYLIKFVLVLLIFNITSCYKADDGISEVAKIALRDAGNSLLIANHDSTSLILPITKVGKNKYELAFQNKLSILPDNLVSMMKSSLMIVDLPESYRVEVLKCGNEEVAYSYQINKGANNEEIACGERALPEECYLIQLRFLEGPDLISISYLILLAIVVLSFGFAFRKKKKPEGKAVGLDFSKIGEFEFYQEQSKLVRGEEELNLTNKECELLMILSSNVNEVVKRDELMKRVWEDHGVFVGRSLDTYISKLRKKLKQDPSIKISNVHGVGYKLEVV